MNGSTGGVKILVSFILATALYAEPFGQAKVTKAEGSVIRGKAGVQTGPGSKAEVDFGDGTVARVGANAKFSYVPGTRETVLDSGTLLLSAPKDAGGITVRAGGTITEAAGAVDFEAVNFGGNVKVISLNGKPTVSLAINPESRKGLRPGQILEVPKGVLKLPKADVVDLKVLIGSSAL
jgi:ferric-dicitrate binding protein FerR (iron transport regulator)